MRQQPFRPPVNTLTHNERKGTTMKKTKYEFGDLRVIFGEGVKEDLMARGKEVFIDEIHRLVESFGNKLLMTKAAGPIDFTNKTSGISILLDMQWESDDSAVVYVQQVNLDNPQPAAVVE